MHFCATMWFIRKGSKKLVWLWHQSKKNTWKSGLFIIPSTFSLSVDVLENVACNCTYCEDFALWRMSNLAFIRQTIKKNEFSKTHTKIRSLIMLNRSVKNPVLFFCEKTTHRIIRNGMLLIKSLCHLFHISGRYTQGLQKSSMMKLSLHRTCN